MQGTAGLVCSSTRRRGRMPAVSSVSCTRDRVIRLEGVARKPLQAFQSRLERSCSLKPYAARLYCARLARLTSKRLLYGKF